MSSWANRWFMRGTSVALGPHEHPEVRARSLALLLVTSQVNVRPLTSS